MKRNFILMMMAALLWLYTNGQNTPTIINSSESSAVQSAQSLQSAGLVVRVPTQQNKLKYLTSQLNTKSLSTISRQNIENLLNETLRENEEHLSDLVAGFSDYWDVSKVYFVPDSLFKSFVAGSRNVFLNVENNGRSITDIAIPNGYFLMLHETDKTKLILVNGKGERLDAPFPYKKNVFFPAFKKIMNKKKYVHDQIKWLNNKIEQLLNVNNG